MSNEYLSAEVQDAAAAYQEALKRQVAAVGREGELAIQREELDNALTEAAKARREAQRAAQRCAVVLRRALLGHDYDHLPDEELNAIFDLPVSRHPPLPYEAKAPTAAELADQTG